jgi:hypothetical protein
VVRKTLRTFVETSSLDVGVEPSPLTGKKQEVPNSRASSRVKAWKPIKSRKEMVMGRDVGFQKVVGMTLQTLVGKFSYRALAQRDMGNWMELTWLLILGLSAEILHTPAWLD